ncbi:uncharacterized protein [Rutidosis leptorrhynchoides]|uniref:uncharacterized protein n=1 Tax=Rutidosis leptorrhynchoides TaxID=125765 RepID=UPI003A994F1C
MAASRFGCCTGQFPFKYLGLPIGQNMNKLGAWKPIIDKFTKRFSEWKARTMSYGGRLTLIKSVLCSLPLYYFSLFRAPSSVINLLEKMRRKFFWGGSGGDSKLSWVKWELVLIPYGVGELNIGSLKSKNCALVGKWWWRFHNESDSLWVKIIKSIYGRDEGLGHESSLPSSRTNSVWCNIIKLRNDMLNIGMDINSCFERKIGDGHDILFWNDVWLSNLRLKDYFPRLFRLETNQNATIKDRVQYNEGSSGFRARQRVMGVQLGYKRKIGLFVWHARRKRIPIRVELDKHGVDLDYLLCPLCADTSESVEHALFECSKVREIWDGICRWWGCIIPTSAGFDSLFSGGLGTGFSGFQIDIWKSVIWVAGYYIWKYRNQKVFRNVAWGSAKIISQIQLKSFEWISNRSKKMCFNWHKWLLDPHNSLFDPSTLIQAKLLWCCCNNSSEPQSDTTSALAASGGIKIFFNGGKKKFNRSNFFWDNMEVLGKKIEVFRQIMKVFGQKLKVLGQKLKNFGKNL